MSKYLSYELKQTGKTFLVLILAILLVNILIYPSIFAINERGGGFFAGLAFTLLIIFIAVLNFLFFFLIISSFRRDLYQEQGYLTFSLPVTRKAYLSSKLFSTTFWILLLWILTLVINFFMLRAFFGQEELDMIYNYIADTYVANPYIVVGGILWIVVSLILSLIFMYFSILVMKAIFKTNYLGFLWFPLFLGLDFGVDYGLGFISRLFPLYLMNESSPIQWIQPGEEHLLSGPLLYRIENADFEIPAGLNLPSILFSIILGLIFFFLAQKILEKKIDI